MTHRETSGHPPIGTAAQRARGAAVAIALACTFGLAGVARMAAAEEASPLPTEITSRHLESTSTDKEMRTLFTGDVTITGTGIRITCDRLEVVSLRKGPKEQVVARQNRFQSLLATGRVKIVQGDREATCGRAVVLPGENRITLTENPMVIDNSAGVTWLGDQLHLLRGERRVWGDNVKLIGPPIKDLGFDRNQKLELLQPGAQPSAPAPQAPPSKP